MSDETVTPEAETERQKPDSHAPEVEKQEFLDRLNKESAKRKEAEEKAAEQGKQLSELQRLIEERENASLPELERERRRAEALEKRAAEAEKRAADAEGGVAAIRREQWLTAAASAEGFVNPARAAQLVENMAGIEDADQAARAVRKLAKSDPYLIKQQDTPLPGRVLQDGKQTKTDEKAEPDMKAGLGAELLEGLFGGRR